MSHKILHYLQWSWILALGSVLTVGGLYGLLRFVQGSYDNIFVPLGFLAVGLVFILVFVRKVKRLRRLLPVSIGELPMS
jgi:hypothetical protein